MALDRMGDFGRGDGDFQPPQQRRNFPQRTVFERIPPQNIEAEQAVLGAMLLGDRGAVEKASEMLAREDFYREAHGHVFEAMIGLAEKDEPVDAVTLKDELARRGVYDLIGGAAYLMALGDAVPTTANVGYYAKIVQEKAILRRLIEASSHISGLAYGDVDDVDTLVDQAERTIFGVSGKRTSQFFFPLRPLLNEAFEKIDTLYHEKGITTGVDTGFNDLNYITSGLQDGDLVIIAARPSMGKTSLAVGIGQNAALRAEKSVAIFSLEMSKEQLVQRMICSEARVDAHRLRTGFLKDEDWTSIAEAVQRLWDANLFIDDSTDTSALEMRAKCRRLRAEHGLDLVIVDYLQLMRGHGRNNENRNQEITEIARGLKGLARELKVPVIALSQLSRAVERREDKRPMLSDLRECVTGDTRLVCADTGRLIPIASISSGERILSVGKQGEIVAATVADVWSTGIKPVFRVVTETGRVIESTENHPFLTPEGFKRLRDVGPDGIVATLRRNVEQSPRYIESDLLWERIRSVEAAGEQETWDICVPETGNFLAEGIVVHNSGAIEAEADVVGFIYRPAYYERKEAISQEAEEQAEEARRPGEYGGGEEAEVIIAKQRNGPTGTVKLSFLPKFARFDNLAEHRDEDGGF